LVFNCKHEFKNSCKLKCRLGFEWWDGMGWPWDGMGWLWDGYGMVMGWLWDGYGMVMGCSWDCIAWYRMVMGWSGDGLGLYEMDWNGMGWYGIERIACLV
jgi:hypothetical protein